MAIQPPSHLVLVRQRVDVAPVQTQLLDTLVHYQRVDLPQAKTSIRVRLVLHVVLLLQMLVHLLRRQCLPVLLQDLLGLLLLLGLSRLLVLVLHHRMLLRLLLSLLDSVLLLLLGLQLLLLNLSLLLLLSLRLRLSLLLLLLLLELLLLLGLQRLSSRGDGLVLCLRSHHLLLLLSGHVLLLRCHWRRRTLGRLGRVGLDERPTSRLAHPNSDGRLLLGCHVHHGRRSLWNTTVHARRWTGMLLKRRWHHAVLRCHARGRLGWRWVAGLVGWLHRHVSRLWGRVHVRSGRRRSLVLSRRSCWPRLSSQPLRGSCGSRSCCGRLLLLLLLQLGVLLLLLNHGLLLLLLMLHLLVHD